MSTLVLQITDEQMAALNTAATEAGFTVYEYARLRLGFVEAAQAERSKRELLAPNLENKDAATVERPRSRRANSPATQ